MEAKPVLFLAVSQILEQCLAHKRCLINVCGLNPHSPETGLLHPPLPSLLAFSP